MFSAKVVDIVSACLTNLQGCFTAIMAVTLFLFVIAGIANAALLGIERRLQWK
jgi:hypothetical protein